MPSSQEEWLLLMSLISGSLALFFNVLLGMIILTVKCGYIGRYKWLLFLYTCSAAMYGTTEILAPGEFLLVPDLSGSGYIFYDAHRILPIWAAEAVLVTFVSLYVFTIIILTLSFIYRYLAVCDYEKLQVFVRHWKAIALGSIAILLMEMALITYTLMPTTATTQFFEIPFYNTTGLSIWDVAYMGAPFVINGEYNLWVAAMITMFLSLGVCAGSIMITLAFKIWKELHNHTGQSVTLAQNQKRIFVLLMFQLSLPLIFQVIPLQIIMGSAYLHIPSEGIVHYFGCILLLAQVFDPLLTFYFIRPYHMAVFSKLCYCRGKSRVVCSSHTATNPEVVSSRPSRL